ncbi:hypothetical protein RHOFW104T7_08375 [Rhodanobacter thiooxydans]|uniref:Uncharacterized protein n=1 Tax=Rhodanobacter thiooxydans TaxID=416169 RepID=A0A154QJM3_9GAMM|nr:hypothetical protein RHOFW104T7_08375 [Rhodanobacter thiooxydans]
MCTDIAVHEINGIEMRRCQVLNMNVIADTGAVARCIVITVDLQALTFSHRCSQHIRDEMCLRVM